MRKRGIAAAILAILCVTLLMETVCAGDTETGRQRVPGAMQGMFVKGGMLQSEVSRMARTTEGEYDCIHDSQIALAIERLETSVKVEGFGITRGNVNEIINRIWNTNPQLFYLKKWEYTYIPSTGCVTDLVFYYTGSEDEIRRQRAEINLVLTEVGNIVDPGNMTEEEIALALHDYMAVHTKYAYDDYLEGKVRDSAYTIYGALVEGEAVCQGYALAYEYLLELYGITCGVASSDAANHVWNIVKISDSWYHVDVTWDDPVYDNFGQALHSGFLNSTEELLSVNMDPKRSDYRTLTAASCTYEDAAESFPGRFWKDSDAAMYYYRGFWYYADKAAFEIVKYDYRRKHRKTLVRIAERWPVSESPGEYWTDNFCRLVLLEDTIYYSTPFSICALSPVGEGTETVFTSGTPGVYIYGLGILDGELAYVLKTDFDTDEPEVIKKVNASGSVTDPSNGQEIQKPGDGSSQTDPAAGAEETEKKEDPAVPKAPGRQRIRSLKSRKRRCLTVVWEKDSKADGYQICCSTGKKFSGKWTRTVRVKGKKKISYTFKNLKSKKKYYVKVRSYKQTGRTFCYGKYSKRKAIKVS